MKSAKMMRLVILLVVGIAAVGGAMAYRAQQASGKAAAMKEPAAELVKAADIYRTEGPYVDQLFAHAEPIATQGVAGGMIGGGFSEEKYYTALFQAMVDKALTDGKRDVAVSLRTFAVGKGYVDVKVPPAK